MESGWRPELSLHVVARHFVLLRVLRESSLPGGANLSGTIVLATTPTHLVARTVPPAPKTHTHTHTIPHEAPREQGLEALFERASRMRSGKP